MVVLSYVLYKVMYDLKVLFLGLCKWLELIEIGTFTHGIGLFGLFLELYLSPAVG